MSNGDERSYPVSSAKKIIKWSLSFSVEIVLKRTISTLFSEVDLINIYFRYIFIKSASENSPGTLKFCITSVKTRDLEYLKKVIPRYVGTDMSPGLTGSSEQLQAV